MQNNKRGSELTILFKNSKPNFDLENNIGNNLNKTSAQGTLNAWTNGTLVDGTGKVWINEEYLFQIWRTDKATSSYFVDGIPSGDKVNFGGVICINYSAVIYRLNEIIDSPISNQRRDYLRLSENIGKSVRDSDSAEVYRLRYNEYITSVKRELKKSRIKQFNIVCDELTGFKLIKRTSEFHHIRRQSVYPNLVNMIWNGLIINKDTHEIITDNNINDEYDLLDLCQQMGWSTLWFDYYENALSQAGFQ
ncbi:hypothetical protein [Endozoicomonas sp. 4G]|uniref:hypothetical protein n=1 Tax=Endozoicomonas sp. 4G TaxID=2872754 RepID=UPI0020791D83|nr:hypothetical protein [Endozoicomonas sp. 4G]